MGKFFCKKSLDMGPIFHLEIPRHGFVFQIFQVRIANPENANPENFEKFTRVFSGKNP